MQDIYRKIKSKYYSKAINEFDNSFCLDFPKIYIFINTWIEKRDDTCFFLCDMLFFRSQWIGKLVIDNTGIATILRSRG